MTLALNTGFMSLAMKPRSPVASSTASATLPVLAFMNVSMTSLGAGPVSVRTGGDCRAAAGRTARHTIAATNHPLVLVIGTSLGLRS